MAFMSVLAMSVGFMIIAVAIVIVAAILAVVVLVCWILGIVFAVKKKKTLRTIFLSIAGVGTAIGLIIGVWIYQLTAHQTIETKNGEVTVSTSTIWQFSEAIEEDDVEKDFTEEEFQVLQELQKAGMNMEEEFYDGSDALTYFEKMAEKMKITKTQPEMYDRICQMLNEYN